MRLPKVLLVACLVAGAVASAPAAQAAEPPANIACLPFPEKGIVQFNEQDLDAADQKFGTIDAPYVNTADQATVTWRHPVDADTTGFRIERQVGDGAWQVEADVDAGVRFYTDTGLNTTDTYRYRVREEQFGFVLTDPSPACAKPSFVTSEHFILFYRTADCPPVDDADANGRATCIGGSSTATWLIDVLEALRAEYMDHGFPDVTTPDQNNDPIRLPVDVFPCDGVGCARSADGTYHLAFTPSNMEPVFDPANPSSKQTSLWTPLHELYHRVQGRQGGCCDDDPWGKWISEGTARSMQDKICVPAGGGGCGLHLDAYSNSNYLNDASVVLEDPNDTLMERSYKAALFWTYLSEQYGNEFGADSISRGIDFLRELYDQPDGGKDGIETVTDTLAALGHSDTFEDAYVNFTVANYAKDIPGAPAQYRYADQDEPQGQDYPAPSFEVDVDPLTPADQAVGVSAVEPWGAQYYRVAPDAAVDNITIAVNQQLSNDVHYRVLAVKDGNIAEEVSSQGPDLETSFPNDDFDEVVLAVVGLEDGAVYNYAINGQHPELNLVDPLATRPAQAGDPADPDKILVKVEVLSPLDGTPVPGIVPSSDFTLAVGGLPVDLTSNDELIASAYVQGQYWMVLRPPVQPADGDYDLTATYAGLAGTEAGAVQYAPLPDADSVVVIDRSGSMATNGKLQAAKDAGRLYVDSWESGDQIGVVSFGTVGNVNATIDYDLVPWSGISRQESHDAINALVADGSTAIGAGLGLGLGELAASGFDDHAWAEILLSDGQDNTDPLIEDFLEDYDARVAAGDKVPVVHTVALGPDADREKLEELAAATGGTFLYASDANAQQEMHNELAEIYRGIGEDLGRSEQVIADRRAGPFGSGINIHEVPVDGASRSATFVVNWAPAGFPADISLVSPGGAQPAPALSDATHRVWKVADPEEGDWRIVVRPAQGAEGSYLAEAAVGSDLTMDAFLGLKPSDRLVGAAMPIAVSLSELAGIPGATVSADVTDPFGNVHHLNLFDDGLHGDGGSGDGFYGRTFTQTSLPGAYKVVVTAEGTSELSGEFRRRDRLSFAMRGELADLDGDGLPDYWERERGTNPAANDFRADSDGDGLTHGVEFTVGTHPRDPDTDEGGESDGSEVARGADPLERRDDAVRRPRARPHAGNGRVFVRYSYDAAPAPTGVGILRSTDGGQTWSDLGTTTEPGGEFVDEAARNGAEHCYRVYLVRDLPSRGDPVRATSAPAAARCVTPKADPNAPFGQIEIGGGRAVTNGLDVELRAQASDNPEGAEFTDHGLPPTHEGATRSGVRDMRVWNWGEGDGARWEPFDPGRTWRIEPRDGVAFVFVQFRDAAGNVSEVEAASIAFDDVAPETTITSSPPALTNSREARFEFTAGEAGATLQCRLDGGSFTSCTSPLTLTGLPDGSHTFEARATDLAGNDDPTPAAFTWTVDTVAPDTFIDSGPPAQTSSANAEFVFSSSESGSTFQCSVDGGAFFACSSPRTLFAMEDGPHDFRARASDALGNVDATPASHAWTVDTSAPELAITRPVPGLYVLDQQLATAGTTAVVAGAVTVQVRAYDLLTGLCSFELEVDGSPVDPRQVTFDPGTKTYSYLYRPSSAGFHTIAARATNCVGMPAAASTTILAVPV